MNIGTEGTLGARIGADRFLQSVAMCLSKEQLVLRKDTFTRAVCRAELSGRMLKAMLRDSILSGHACR